jgi:hypothetical protein
MVLGTRKDKIKYIATLTYRQVSSIPLDNNHAAIIVFTTLMSLVAIAAAHPTPNLGIQPTNCEDLRVILVSESGTDVLCSFGWARGT